MEKFASGKTDAALRLLLPFLVLLLFLLAYAPLLNQSIGCSEGVLIGDGGVVLLRCLIGAFNGGLASQIEIVLIEA